MERIVSAEQFVRLCDEAEPDPYDIVRLGEADDAVWLDILDRYPAYRRALVWNKTVPPRILDVLSTDADPQIRYDVAGRRRLAPETFERLARDPDSGVREAIADNAKTPIGLLELLSRDSNPHVRSKAQREVDQRRGGP